MEWSKDYEVGVASIDQQHQSLFTQLNELNAAITGKRTREVLEPLLEFLGDYVVMHFSTERELMTRHQYPASMEHYAEHEAFVKAFLEMKQRFHDEGSTLRLATMVNGFVCSWLLKHVLGTDRKLGYFLAQSKR